MPTFIATLLKVETVTRKKASYDAEGAATIREERFGSNPEYACVPIEAESQADAEKQAKAILQGELRGLGWTSYGDTELWGKDLRVLVDVVPEAEHVERFGQGNRAGSESQADREARLRKAAQV